jgi:hypothetical protein
LFCQNWGLRDLIRILRKEKIRLLTGKLKTCWDWKTCFWSKDSGTKSPPPPQCLIAFYDLFRNWPVFFVLSVFSILIRNTERTKKFIFRFVPKLTCFFCSFGFFDTDSKHRTHREIYSLVLRNKPKMCWNRWRFGLNIFFVCGHPSFYVVFSFFSVCFETDLFVSVI